MGIVPNAASVEGRVIIVCSTTRQVVSDVDHRRVILRDLTKGVELLLGAFKFQLTGLPRELAA